MGVASDSPGRDRAVHCVTDADAVSQRRER